MKAYDPTDYKDNAEAYDLEELSRPDEMAMLDLTCATALRHLDTLRDASVLDLCCGTGLSHRWIPEHPNVSQILGVDTSAEYLDRARTRSLNCRRVPRFELADAVVHQIESNIWDIVILASAYHHIEDARKQLFLSHVRRLIRPHGIVVMAENVLPEYEIGNAGSYANAVRQFYSCVLDTALSHDPSLPDLVRQLIWKPAQYGIDGDYEYKVSWPILNRDIERAGFCIANKVKVWPLSDGSLGVDGGNFVLTLVAR